MKNRRKILISCLFLGTLGLSYILYETSPVNENADNTEFIEEKEKEEKPYVITSKEEEIFFENVDLFKKNELKILQEKYEVNVEMLKGNTSDIDTKAYTEQELADIHTKYVEESGDNSLETTLGEALIFFADQEYAAEVSEIEKYAENTLDTDVLKNKTTITIPDEALKEALAAEIDTEGDIYFKDIARITKLNLKGADITSFEGLQYAVNLEKLELDGATFDPDLDFKPLGFLQNLKNVNLLNVFKDMNNINLEFLPSSVEYVAIEEDIKITNPYTYSLLSYVVNEEQTESTETTPESFFIFDSETKTIEGFISEVDQTLYIPAKIGGIEVEKIAQDAFKNKGIKTLKLPDSNIYLGSSSFLYNEITEVEVSNKIENINGAVDFEVNVTITTGGI